MTYTEYMNDDHDMAPADIPTLTDMVMDNDAPDAPPDLSALPELTERVGGESPTSASSVAPAQIDIRDLLAQHQADIEAFVEDIAEDIQGEMNIKIEEVVTLAVEAAVREAMEKSSELIKKGISSNLRSSLPALIDTLVDDIVAHKRQ